MFHAVPRIAWAILCCLSSSEAYAQYEIGQQQSLWLRALFDIRIARAGPAPSWTDSGPGKTRYGGRSTGSGFESATRFALSELAIEVGASLPGDVRAQAQVNIQPDVADSYQPWLIEAILRKEWGDGSGGLGVQTGVMNVPFSLEHVGPAWSPEYTISASALDSWLWEEMSLAGAESEWWRATKSGIRLGALLGAAFGSDQLGKLLALRGWTLGDVLGGLNGNLPLPGRTDRIDIFSERDHRPAVYTWFTLSDEREIASLKAGFFDNRGDQDKAGVWHTHFSTVAVTLHPHPRVDLLAQYLNGVARVRSPANDSALSVFYVLLSHHYKGQRVTFRYDSFRVHDLDGGPSSSERGDAFTAAYLIQLGLRHRIAFEHIWASSHRLARPLLDPTRAGWQLSYRFRY